MPLTWELYCPKRVRSRRTLYQEGITSLRRDEGVRRVEPSKTTALLCAKITFWNDSGPADKSLAWLREEFSRANEGKRPAIETPRIASPMAFDFETSMSMGTMVPFQASLNMEEVRTLSRIDQGLASDMVAAFLATREGLARLSQSMVEPIRRMMDFGSLSRRILIVDQLPDGALPRYDRIIEPGSIYVNSEPEFVGRMPVRSELTVLPADPGHEPLGWTMTERIGRGIRGRGMRDQFELNYGARAPAIVKSFPVLVPEWCVPSRWAYDDKLGRYAFVESTYDGNRAGVRYWNKGRISRKLTIVPGRELRAHWMPCTGPKLPRKSWWEDLEDEF